MARIAFVLPNMAGGGAERVALTLIEHFSRVGHRVDLLLCQAAGELLTLVPPEVTVIDLGAPRFRGALRPIARYLREQRPDAMQVSMWPLTVLAILARKMARAKTRLMIVDHTTLSRQYGGILQFQLLRWTTKLFYPLADVRAVVSSEAADDLARLSGIRRESIDVVYNPLQLDCECATNDEIEALWGGARTRILSVGSLKPAKNHRLLLDAFALLLRKRPPARLMIVGEGALRQELEAHAASLGIADRVAMPGFAIDPQPFFASADLFALSSDREGLPVVLVEALNAGLRVVSTECVSGPSEILENGRYGRLVPCGDAEALSQAIDDALADRVDPAALRRRAAQLAGAGAIARYSELMLGG